MSNTTPESPDAPALDRFAKPPLAGTTESEPMPSTSVEQTRHDAQAEAEPDVVDPAMSTPLAGIAEALAALELLTPSNGSDPAPALDRATGAADDRVFARATSQMPDGFGGDDRVAVQPRSSTPRVGGDSVPDDLLPDFFRADAPVAVVERPRSAVSLDMPNAAPRGKPSLARTFAEIPVLLIVAAVIAFLVKSLLAQAYYIPSGSMLPQLQIDDRVVVSKLAYKVHDPRRGDIIVFDDPRPGVDTTKTVERTGVSKLVRKVGEGIGIIQPSTDEFIKRVVGLPGDKVAGHDGHVYINGHKLLEPYLKASVETSDFPEQTIATGKLWVMGDNRTGSADSRVFGQIKIKTIVGRAVVKVWPFSHISFL